MKKVIAVFLVFCLAFSLFAADSFYTSNEYSKIGKAPYQPKNLRMLGMGGAGVAMNDSAEGLYINPAALGSGKFQMSLPSVSVTANHIYDVFEKDSSGKSAYSKIYEELNKDEDMNVGKILDPVLGVLGTAYTDLASVDASFSMIMPFGFGFGVSASDTIHMVNGAVIDEANVSLVAGLGFGIDLGIGKLNVGATAKMNALALNESISAGDVVSRIENDDFDKTPIAIGYATPIDIGAQFVFANGLSVGAVASNFNGNYKMAVSEFKDIESLEDADFNLEEIVSKPVLSAGVAYEKKGFFNTKMAADIVDLNGFAGEFDSEEPGRVIMKHLNAGLEINFVDLIAVRAGISQGYMSVGTSFNLMLMRVDAAYYWKEMGEAAGQKGLDSFSIRFNLGFER